MTHMIDARKELLTRCDIQRSYKTINIPDSAGYIKVLSSDAGGSHGQNVHVAVIDEVHAHKNRELIDVLQTAIGSRKQPLIIYTTTADFQRESICNELYKKGKGVQNYDAEVGTGIDDARFLPVIYEIEDNEDYRDPKVWAKVNPNLGVSVSEEFIREEVKEAEQNLAYQNTVMRLYFNKRTKTDVQAIDLTQWEACKWQYPVRDTNDKKVLCTPRRWREDQFNWLKSEPCYAGLDMSSVNDLTSFVLWFPRKKIVIPFFWLPGANADVRQRRDGVPYQTWIKYKYIRKTPGEYVDQEAVIKTIKKMFKHFNVKQIGIDPYGAQWVFPTLMDLVGEDRVFQVSMTGRYMTDPYKDVVRMIGAGELNHGGNPILSWMAGNLVVKEAHDGRIHPHKVASIEKIDGIIAMFCALAVWRRNAEEKKNVYNDRKGGLLFDELFEDED